MKETNEKEVEKKTKKKTVKKATEKNKTTKKVTKKSTTPKKKKVTEKEVVPENKEEVKETILEDNKEVKQAEEIKEEVKEGKPVLEVKENKNTFRTFEVILLVVITAIVSISMGVLLTYSLLRNDNESGNYSDELEELIKNYNYIKENYDDVTEKELLNGAISGMLDAVGDPYAGFIEQDSRLEQELTGSLYGVGIEIINNSDGNIEVYSVFEDSPAGRGGLQVGDIIDSVNGLDLTGKSTSVLSTYIQGNATDTFEIEYTRDGEKKEVTLKKEYVVIPSVFSNTFEKNGKKVGYLQITIFSATTYNQFKEKLEELEEEGIDSLVIDVRGNSGGRLDAVADIISLFLDDTHVIYQTDTDGEIEKFYSTGKTTKTYDIAVLIDGSSASASEVLASALNEQYGATLVGQKTYGKGTVQQIKTLQNGDEYKLTTKEWLTSKGVEVNGKGIEPTVSVELDDAYCENPSVDTDNQLQTALEEVTK